MEVDLGRSPGDDATVPVMPLFKFGRGFVRRPVFDTQATA
jgi:hypothetical protein